MKIEIIEKNEVVFDVNLSENNFICLVDKDDIYLELFLRYVRRDSKALKLTNNINDFTLFIERLLNLKVIKSNEKE